MDEKRNLILAIVLSSMVLIGWQYFFMPEPAPYDPKQTEATQQNADGRITPNATVGAAPNAETGISLANPEEVIDESPVVTINSDAVVGTIALQGARINQMILHGYRETLEEDSPEVSILKTAPQSYFATYGWLSASTQVPDSETLWSTDRSELTPNQPVTLSWTNLDGVTFQLRYSIVDRFLIKVDQLLKNASDQEVNISSYGLISRGGTPETSGFYILHEGPIGVLGDKLEEISYDDLFEDKSIRRNSSNGWIGLSDKYWLTAMIPEQGVNFNAAYSASGFSMDDPLVRYQTDFILPQNTVAAGASVSETSHLFVGAKETLLLDRYRDDFGFHQFDLAVDFGVLYFITKPIFYALSWIYSYAGNFGIAILLLTVAIKLVFFPLSNKSYVSMSKMKLLQPKMQELKERYGEDRQKLNMEMMELYKREKVNPVSGCLPILLQIPVFFALYKVLFVTIEMRHTPFFGWISDLSAPDPLGMLTLFGLVDWQIPAFLTPVNLGIWPIIMGLTMWLQQRLNPTPTDPIQAKIFAWMPAFFTFLLATFPAGLVIYWAWNNTLTIIQQWVIMRRINTKNAQ